MIPAFLRAQDEGTCLNVRLQPRARQNEIGEALGSELRIKVTAPPVDAAANQALVRLLAERLECPRGAVRLIKGHTSRHKVVFVEGLKPEEVMQRLP